MNSTDDTRPHYGKLSGVHPRAKKKIWLAHKLYIDGEDATMAINTSDSMEMKEAFVDQLPDTICYSGYPGLVEAFKEWKRDNKK